MSREQAKGVITYITNVGQGTHVFHGRIEEFYNGQWTLVHPNNVPMAVMDALCADGDLIGGEQVTVNNVRYRTIATIVR